MSHSDNKKLTRREERQQALDFLFERLFRDDTVSDQYADAADARDVAAGKYAGQLINGVGEHLTEIDGIISDNLKGWKLNRISRVALVLLRIAVYEIRYVDNVPDGAAINEAVELAKIYSTAEDASFINGVLGAVVRTAPAADAAPAPDESGSTNM